MRLDGPREDVQLSGDDAFPVNEGALCIKGWTAAELLDHPERLRTPLARDDRGELVPVGWDEALDRVAHGLRAAQERHGRDAVGLFGGGSLTNEKAYLLGKFARVVLRTSNIDYNGRFCMASAAAAELRAFGLDRGMPFPIADIEGAEVVLLAGANSAETMPPFMRSFERQRQRGGRLIVADPRRSLTGQAAALHLRLAPGTDAALANGILHVLVRDGLVDEAYVAARTEGFAAAKAAVAAYWPERVEGITGVPEADIVAAARMLGTAKTSMILTARGVEQHAHGVDNVLAYINVALALGQVGRLHGGFGTITGQGNGQGGREHGQKADQLPGYRRIDDPDARRHIAAVWGVEEASIPGPGLSAYELLDGIGRDGGVRALVVMGSNLVVSAPNASHIEERLRALNLLVVADFFLSETALLAHVVLPAAQWAEEEGTTTNLEGRVLHRRRVFAPPTGVRSDLEILHGIAERLGAGHAMAYADARDVFDELRRASAGGAADYAGITYERIDAEGGVFWPCPDEAHPGTPRLFATSFPRPGGRATFHAIQHGVPAEEVDGGFPLYLTTGRVLAQYQSGTQTRRVRRLAEMAPEPVAEIHPLTAAQYGLVDGRPVRIATRRGVATFRAKLTAAIREDTVFAPFHWGGDGCANRLTNPALDPVSRMPEFKVCAARVEDGNGA